MKACWSWLSVKFRICNNTMTLTHWVRMTHICVGKLTIIGSYNGLSPGQCQAIIWTSDGILLIWPLGTKFSEIFIAINIFSFKKMHLNMSSAKCRPYCLSLNVLTPSSSLTEAWWHLCTRPLVMQIIEADGLTWLVLIDYLNQCWII